MSSRLSWVNIVQYDNATRTVGINSRIHWIPEAGRELFIVLNHNLEDPPELGFQQLDDDFVSATADLTIKYRHTFRY